VNQNSIPLFEALNQYKRNNPISYHVPGHKNGFLYKGESPELSNFLQYDVTELRGLDDLHAPDGPIFSAQQLLSSYYGTKKSYFLVNGSTVGNLAAILASFNTGDVVLVQRNCHKSILNALSIANIKPIFLSPKVDHELCIPVEMELSTIKEAFFKNQNIKGCILTYPNYYGLTYHLKDIIEIVHQNNGLVIVDEAHGPHFRLGYPFPVSAINLKADIIIHSAHKMLPAMTMGSYLHINSARVLVDKVEYYLSALQSSSPSYPIMMSLDLARHYLATFTKEDLEYTLLNRNHFVNELSHISGLTVKNMIGQDPLKIIVSYEGYSGYELQGIFEKEGVYTELADQYQVLFILPLLKKGVQFPFLITIEKMKMSLKECHPIIRVVRPSIRNEVKLSQPSYTYGEMKDKEIEWVDFDHAIDRVAAKMIIPYPPGIPLLLPGEIIKLGQLENLKRLIELKAKFQGDVKSLSEGKISVFKT
jgi:arginine/lysine/ornithine decarboxylase